MSEFKDAALDGAIRPADPYVARLAGITLAHTVLPEPCPDEFDVRVDVPAEDKARVDGLLRMVGLK